jgi:hypothetical protein
MKTKSTILGVLLGVAVASSLAAATPTPTMTRTPTPIITPTPDNRPSDDGVISLNPFDLGQNAFTRLQTYVTPIPGAQQLLLDGDGVGCRALLPLNGSSITFQVAIPSDYDGYPKLYAYGSKGQTYTATAYVNTVVTVSRLGEPLSVSHYASADADVAAVLWPSSANGSGGLSKRNWRIMLPISGTASPVPTGLYSRQALRPGDLLTIQVKGVSGTASELNIRRIEFAYRKKR